MDNKEILKQIYAQALSNRQDSLVAAQEQTKAPDDLPEGVTERERILHEVMGVYRQKRQMIDDLPPKHRMLLEKVSRLMLGVKDSKKEGREH